ncbi:MAG: YcfL family protein [Planctomycetota bacterium]
MPTLANTAPLALVFACLVGLSACTSGNTSSARATNQSGRPQIVDDVRFSNDPGFDKRITLVGIIEGEGPGGEPRVEAELYNETGEYQTVQYRFEWFDENGFAVRTGNPGFRDVQIPPTDAVRVSSMAPAGGVDFKLSTRR